MGRGQKTTLSSSFARAAKRHWGKSLFAVLVLSLAAFEAAILAGLLKAYTPVKQALLTDGEEKLAKALFKEDFKTSDIYKSYYSSWIPCGSAETIACVRVGDTNIRFVMQSYFTDDYSRDGSPHTR